MVTSAMEIHGTRLKIDYDETRNANRRPKQNGDRGVLFFSSVGLVSIGL